MWRCIFATLLINKILMFPSLSADREAFVTLETCRKLTDYIPADDVAYKGGVDVRGRPVKGADLAPAADLGRQDNISFLLILDILKEKQGAGKLPKAIKDNPGLRGEITFGRIRIKDGVATLDGKPLAAQPRKDLYEFCQKSKKLP